MYQFFLKICTGIGKNKAANYPGQTEADIHKTPEGIQTRNPIQSALITFLQQFKLNLNHFSQKFVQKFEPMRLAMTYKSSLMPRKCLRRVPMLAEASHVSLTNCCPIRGGSTSI
jgi:hypothetical protein